VTDDQTEFNRDEAGVGRAFERADAVLSALIAPDAMAGRHGGGGYPGGGGGPSVGGGGPLGGIIFGRRNPYPGGGGGGRYPGYGGHTQSAGTAQIARDSGGDSMPVDDAYGLETTLSRLRQRYALYFYLPAGGEERSITVDLADAANRRGELVLAGALAEPADGALIIFRGDDPTTASSFAENDPYVRNGLVKHWEVRPWTVVVGGEARASISNS